MHWTVVPHSEWHPPFLENVNWQLITSTIQVNGKQCFKRKGRGSNIAMPRPYCIFKASTWQWLKVSDSLQNIAAPSQWTKKRTASAGWSGSSCLQSGHEKWATRLCKQRQEIVWYHGDSVSEQTPVFKTNGRRVTHGTKNSGLGVCAYWHFSSNRIRIK